MVGYAPWIIQTFSICASKSDYFIPNAERLIHITDSWKFKYRYMKLTGHYGIK